MPNLNIQGKSRPTEQSNSPQTRADPSLGDPDLSMGSNMKKLSSSEASKMGKALSEFDQFRDIVKSRTGKKPWGGTWWLGRFSPLGFRGSTKSFANYVQKLGPKELDTLKKDFRQLAALDISKMHPKQATFVVDCMNLISDRFVEVTSDTEVLKSNFDELVPIDTTLMSKSQLIAVSGMMDGISEKYVDLMANSGRGQELEAVHDELVATDTKDLHAAIIMSLRAFIDQIRARHTFGTPVAQPDSVNPPAIDETPVPVVHEPRPHIEMVGAERLVTTRDLDDGTLNTGRPSASMASRETATEMRGETPNVEISQQGQVRPKQEFLEVYSGQGQMEPAIVKPKGPGRVEEVVPELSFEVQDMINFLEEKPRRALSYQIVTLAKNFDPKSRMGKMVSPFLTERGPDGRSVRYSAAKSGVTESDLFSTKRLLNIAHQVHTFVEDRASYDDLFPPELLAASKKAANEVGLEYHAIKSEAQKVKNSVMQAFSGVGEAGRIAEEDPLAGLDKLQIEWIDALKEAPRETLINRMFEIRRQFGEGALSLQKIMSPFLEQEGETQSPASKASYFRLKADNVESVVLLITTMKEVHVWVEKYGRRDDFPKALVTAEKTALKEIESETATYLEKVEVRLAQEDAHQAKLEKEAAERQAKLEKAAQIQTALDAMGDGEYHAFQAAIALANEKTAAIETQVLAIFPESALEAPGEARALLEEARTSVLVDLHDKFQAGLAAFSEGGRAPTVEQISGLFETFESETLGAQAISSAVAERGESLVVEGEKMGAIRDKVEAAFPRENLTVSREDRAEIDATIEALVDGLQDDFGSILEETLEDTETTFLNASEKDALFDDFAKEYLLNDSIINFRRVDFEESEA